MTEDKKIINPLSDIKNEDYPVMVLVDDLNSPLSSLVKFFNKTYHLREHVTDSYSHIMILYDNNKVATQTIAGYTTKPLSLYMREGMRLKFFSIINIKMEERLQLFEKINSDLNRPWWFRRYDFLGLFGQALHIKWLQSPLSKYCSEKCSETLRVVPYFKPIIPKEPSPSDLNIVFKKYPITFKLLGYWGKS